MELKNIILILLLLLIIIYLIFFRRSEHFGNNTVPKTIYLCYKTKDIPSNIIETWKKLNPDYEVKLFDNQDCEKFLLEKYDQKYVDIFNYIKDGPVKGCFFRICILNKNGGVYSDIDVEPLVPIKDFIEEGVTFATCNSMYNEMLNPHFIYSISNNPILKRCLQIYEEKFDKKDTYEYWSWSSPLIMVYAMRNIFGDKYDFKQQIYYHDNIKYQFLQEINPHTDKYIPHDIYCEYKGKRVLNNRLPNYNPDSHEFQNKKYYFSFTTSPQRVKNLKPILERLQNQTIKPEKIIVNIPPKFKRTNESYDYNIISKLEKDIPLVHFNKVEKDYGPLTKVIGGLQYIKDMNSIVIICDDDIFYKNDFAEKVINKLKDNKNKVVAGFAYRHTHHFGVNVVEGFNGYGFNRNIIDYNKLIGLYNLIEPYTHCYKSDDFVFSYFLKNNNIEAIEIGDGYQPLESYSENEHIDELQTQDGINGHVERYRKCKDYIDVFLNKLPYDVVISGTARDIENHLPTTRKKLEMVSSLFKSSKIIIYENDSKDKTLDILRDWEKEGFIQLITEKNIPGKRTQRLAHGREILYKEAMKHNFDLYIIMDLDDVIQHLEEDNILSTFKMKEDWGMVGGNQVDRLYYDIWALRTFDDWLNFDWLVCRDIEKKGDDYCLNSRLRSILPDADPIQVHSCFGGVGIYKRKYLDNCSYGNGLRDGTTDVEECEHVKFNKCVENNGGKLYINPKMITS